MKAEVSKQHEGDWMKMSLRSKLEKEVIESRDKGKACAWLQRGDLKKETESTIFAAQEQAIRTNAIKHSIDKRDVSPRCRMCGKWLETIAHISSECQQLAGRECKVWRHNKIAPFGDV